MCRPLSGRASSSGGGGGGCSGQRVLKHPLLLLLLLALFSWDDGCGSDGDGQLPIPTLGYPVPCPAWIPIKAYDGIVGGGRRESGCIMPDGGRDMPDINVTGVSL